MVVYIIPFIYNCINHPKHCSPLIHISRHKWPVLSFSLYIAMFSRSDCTYTYAHIYIWYKHNTIIDPRYISDVQRMTFCREIIYDKKVSFGRWPSKATEVSDGYIVTYNLTYRYPRNMWDCVYLYVGYIVNRGKMEHGSKMEQRVFRKKGAMWGSVVMSAWFSSLVRVAWHNNIKLTDDHILNTIQKCNFAIFDHFDG